TSRTAARTTRTAVTTVAESKSVRDLLAAITHILDVPHPARWEDREQRDRLLSNRVALVRGCLRGVVEGGSGAANCATVLRSLAKDYPVTYEPYVREDRPAETDTEDGAR
ncbi:hypothetical protein ACWCXE_27045, partial [Streptomyces sp. NPDC001780]